jgi:hypothetical protein
MHFLGYDPQTRQRLFFVHDPRSDGFKGPIEVNISYEEVEHLHAWPDGTARATPFLGQSKTNPKHYVAFRGKKDCVKAGFEPLGEHFVHAVMRWSEWRGKKDVRFDNRHLVDIGRDVVIFDAQVDQRPFRCEITLEAMMKHFGARSPRDMEPTFLAHKGEIQELATKMIQRGDVKDGKLRIRS